MRKGALSVAFLVFVALFILLVYQFIDKMPILNRILKIEQEVDIIIELNDESSKLPSILNTKVAGSNVMDAIAMELAGIEYDDSYIHELADEMDTTIIVFNETGDAIKTYGSRRLGNILYADVPLPGGNTGTIGVVLDTELPEVVEMG